MAGFCSAVDNYFDLSRGIDHREVQPHRERKSVGAEDTFAADIETLADARIRVVPLVEKVWRICVARDLRPRTVTLKVKFSDFEQITRSKSAAPRIRDLGHFHDLLEALLQAEFPPRLPVRLLGVTASGFAAAAAGIDGQLSLSV